jgi:hypothetical protein
MRPLQRADFPLACAGVDLHKLLFRRDWPFYYACDVLSVAGEDCRIDRS